MAQPRGGRPPGGGGGGPGGGGGGEAGEGVRECLNHVVAAHGGVGAAGQEQAGVVVEDVEDFYVGVIGEAPVGDVGLPELVGLIGDEACPGRAGPFVGLGCDEAAFVQDAPNC